MACSYSGPDYETHPPYDEMPPLAGAMIGAQPDRKIRDANWRHPILWDYPVQNDVYRFIQLIGRSTYGAMRHQILVENLPLLHDFDT